VGRLLQGIESRLEPVEGIPHAGRLVVRGPNVMLGYIRPEQPGTFVAPPGGWYDTGDIVSIDPDGFIAIKGRLKRFAKIGGEMVSLAVVESCASAMWPDYSHAAIAVAGGRKGEEILLVTTCSDAERTQFAGWVHNHGVQELAIPRRILLVESIPVLGTGKTDYAKLTKSLQESGAFAEPETATG
jgi:acyl-[acyl-carrier-protein]-phospholipid O-acyltransferase/long-chain-fatty-acid--[acyl-carrier-protein] ligase